MNIYDGFWRGIGLRIMNGVIGGGLNSMSVFLLILLSFTFLFFRERITRPGAWRS